MRAQGSILRQLHAIAVHNVARLPAGRCPQVLAALASLSRAIDAEFPRRSRKQNQTQGPQRIHNVIVGARVWARRYRTSKITSDKQAADLEKLTAAKTVDGRVAAEWIQRIICCAPHTSARALCSAFHLACGSDAVLVSRPSIGKIKDAWVESYVDMTLAAAGRSVAASLAAAAGAGDNS